MANILTAIEKIAGDEDDLPLSIYYMSAGTLFVRRLSPRRELTRARISSTVKFTMVAEYEREPGAEVFLLSVTEKREEGNFEKLKGEKRFSLPALWPTSQCVPYVPYPYPEIHVACLLAPGTGIAQFQVHCVAANPITSISLLSDSSQPCYPVGFSIAAGHNPSQFRLHRIDRTLHLL